LINEAVQTWQALAGYWVETVTVKITAEKWIYDLPEESARVIVALDSVEEIGHLKETLLEPTVDYLTQYADPAERFSKAVQVAHTDWQQRTRLIVGYRELAGTTQPIDLGADHLGPVYLEWRGLQSNPVTSTRKRLDPISQEWLKHPHFRSSGVPRCFELVGGGDKLLRLWPTPQDIGTVEMFEVASSETVLEIPETVSWALKYKALHQLLTSDGQSRDNARAEYCAKRYDDAVVVSKYLSLYRNARLNGREVMIGSLNDLSTFEPQWHKTVGTPRKIATVGWNNLIVFPALSTALEASVGAVDLKLECYLPPPKLEADTDYLSVPDHVFDALFNFTLHLAMLKVSGKEFAETLPAYAKLIERAMEYNSFLEAYLPELSVGKERAAQEKKDRRQKREVEDNAAN
jgi:hypothetical protein